MQRYIFVLFSYNQFFLGHRRLFKRSKKSPYLHPNYSPFHETLPNSSLLTHCISVRFHEMGDTKKNTLQHYVVLISMFSLMLVCADGKIYE